SVPWSCSGLLWPRLRARGARRVGFAAGPRQWAHRRYGETIMPTDDSGLPVMPILPWQRPPTTRNSKGQWMTGVSGNLKGRPTNARLRTKMLAYDARARRPTAYSGMTGTDLAKVGRAAYGKFWQRQLAADLRMSRRGIIRWVQGVHKISLEKEISVLSLCLRRLRPRHAYVRWMLRRAMAHHNALAQEQIPRHQPLTHPGERRT